MRKNIINDICLKIKSFCLKNTYHFFTILFILNFHDAIFTWLLVQSHLAIELNPLMKWLMNISYYLFLSFKVLIFFPIFYYVTKNNNNRIQVSLTFLFLMVLYLCVLINHLYLLYLVFSISN